MAWKEQKAWRICKKELYEYVKAKGKVTESEIVEKFKMHRVDLENQLATLHHYQLLKGKLEDGTAYLMPC